MSLQTKYSCFARKFIRAAACLIACASFAVVGCNGLGIFGEGDTSDTVGGDTSDTGTEEPLKLTAEEDKIVEFAAGRTSDFYAAHGYSNGGMFNCKWSRTSAVISEGLMNMTVSAGDGWYYGAEYRSRTRYSYGYYSVCMKAARGSGIVSSFFTYTGSPWDEIDIEFLGKDTTHVQFNYYVSGTGSHELWYDLGFDAAEEFHEYGFDWQPGFIAWYVDGRQVYKVTQNIPSHDQQIMANVWNCTGHDDWTGPLDENALPATAQYKWIAYKAN